MTLVPTSSDQYSTLTPTSGEGVGGLSASFGDGNNQLLTRRITLLKAAVPSYGTSPDGIKLALQLAQSSMDDDTMIRTAQTSAAQSMTDNMRKQLDAMEDPLAKQKMWLGLDPMQQNLLKQGGFVPPHDIYDPGDTSVFGITKHMVGGLFHDLTQNPISKPILGALGKPISAIQHLERAGSLGVQEEGFFGLGGSLDQSEIDKRHKVQNWLGDFMNLWSRTGNGEKTFAISAQDRVHQAIPDADKYHFVEALAAGQDPYDYLTKTLKLDPNTPTFQTDYLRYAQYVADPVVQGAVTDLKNNKLSVGRDLARGIGIKPGTTSFNVLSGGLDATFDIFGDPTMIAGEALGAYRVARLAIDVAKLGDEGYLAGRVAYLAEKPRFSQAMDLIAQRFNEGNRLQLLDEIPATRKGLNDMSTYFANQVRPVGEGITRTDVIDYFSGTAGSMDLAAGRWSVPHFEGITLPSYGKVDQFKTAVTTAVKAGVDNFRLADYGLDGLNPEQLSTMFQGRVAGIGPKWSTIAQAQAGVGEFMKGFITKVPHEGFINPFDHKAPQTFRSMMDYTLPKEMQQGFMEDFLGATSIDARRAVYNSAIDAMWHYSGAYGTDVGKDILRQVTQRDQVYMGAGEDILNGLPAGVLKSDAATSWAIPSFRDMLDATSEVTKFRRILDETNNGLTGRFMNVWRPTVLLRVGFIPRAYGEELLNFIGREGFRSYAKAQATLISQRTGEDLALLKPVNWIADGLFKHIPLVGKGPMGDAASAVAHNMVGYTSQYFRDFAEKLAPDEYLEAARNITRFGGQDAVMRELGQFHGLANESLGAKMKAEQVWRKNASGDVERVEMSRGDITTHMYGDEFYHQTVHREMNRVADDELTRPALDGLRRQIGTDEGDQLANLMYTHLFQEEPQYVEKVASKVSEPGPVPEGHVRLWRGEPSSHPSNVGDLGSPVAEHPDVPKGAFYTPERSTAEGFATGLRGDVTWTGDRLGVSLPPGSKLYYTDVPKSEAAKYEKFSHYGERGRGEPVKEYALPSHLQGSRQEAPIFSASHEKLSKRLENITSKIEAHKGTIADAQRELDAAKQHMESFKTEATAEPDPEEDYMAYMRSLSDDEVGYEANLDRQNELQDQLDKAQEKLDAAKNDPTHYDNLQDQNVLQGVLRDQFGLVKEQLPLPSRSSYGRTLLNARNIVPNEVMPSFEMYLKNPSFVSTKSVKAELLAHGMSEGDAYNLVDEILPRMTERQRISIFTRDGEMERMLQARTLDPEAAWEYDTEIPHIRGKTEEYAKQRYEDHLLDLWSPSTSTNTLNNLGYDRLSQGDMGDLIRNMRRGQEVEGRMNVASPAVPGTKRVYTVVSPPNLVYDAENSSLGYAKLGEQADKAEGWVPITHSHALDLSGRTGGNVDVLNTLVNDGRRQIPKGEAAWFSTDHDEAMRLQQKFFSKNPHLQANVGYVDIPDDVFKAGQNAAKADVAGGLDPLAKATQSQSVLVPENWRQGYQAVGDNYQLLSPELTKAQRELEAAQSELALHHERLDSIPGERLQAGRVESLEVQQQEAIAAGDEQRASDLQEELLQAQHMRKQLESSNTAIAKAQAKVQEAQKAADLATGVSQTQALKDWGFKLNQRVQQVFGGNGDWDESMANVAHNALEGNLRIDDLWPLKTTQLPQYSVGPQMMVPHADGWFNRLVRNGFDHITTAGDAMTRSPMYLHEYTKAMVGARASVEAALGEPMANKVIDELASQLGVSRGKAISAWYSLPEDIRQSANPLEAAIARDPIPPNLRLLNKQDLNKLGSASESLLQLKDPQLLKELQLEIENKGNRIENVFPGLKGEGSITLDHLVDSYLSLPDDIRQSLLAHGNPPQFPEELLGGASNAAPLNADQWTQFRDAIESNRHLEQTIHEVATDRALSNTIPWIHDHHLRTQFQEHARNFIPFWFAQENFIRRIANSVMRDPVIIRKAQLGLHGLQTFGAIEKNQFGEDIFNIPATGALVKVLQGGASIFGNYSLPIVEPMTGQLKYALPGINELNNIAPSFSPVVGLPIHGLTKLFPEIKPLDEMIAGERGTSQLDVTNPLEEVLKPIVPSWLYKFYSGLVHNPESDKAMASSAIQTAQMLESAGLGIKEAQAGSLDSPSDVMQQYLDRLQNHTRLTTMVKGIVGFISPVSPSTDPVEDFSPEFQKLLRTMPLQDALTSFIAAHPDGLPYTVFKTKVPSGAPLPASPEVEKILTDNPGFFAKYPDAAPWFLPQSDSQDSFSQSAYAQQMAMGLRTRKSLKDWYRDYYFASAAPTYFATKDGFDQRYAGAKGNPQLRQQMQDQYQTWKDNYFKQHPVFAEEIQSPEGKQRRERVITGMTQALNDPNAPDVLHKDAMGTMLGTYQGMQARLKLYNHGTASDQTIRGAIKDQFQAWATTYVQDHPQIKAFYSRVIQPEAGI